MQSILEILNQLANTPSTNDKIKLLQENVYNDILGQCFYLALSPRVKFYIKKIPQYDSENVIMTLQEALIALGCISSRKITGNDAIEHLKYLLESLDKDDAIVLERIIGKDLKCGVNVATANKIWNSYIEETPYQGAQSFSIKKLNKLFNNEIIGVVSDEKIDGRYCNTLILNDSIVQESRGGETTYLNDTFDFLSNTSLKNIVLNGELVINKINDEVVDRYTSNGIIAALISIFKKEHNQKDTTKDRKDFVNKYKISIEDATNSIDYICWDLISYYEYTNGFSDEPYHSRLDKLKTFIDKINNPRLKLVDSKMVKTIDESMTDFYDKISQGKEGTIVKSLSAGWKHGKHPYSLKVKLEMTVDLKIKGFNKGKNGTRFENTLGSLICVSNDSLLETDPAGITDEMRDFIWNNQESLLDTIVEIKCSGVSKSKNNDLYSMLHPRFVKLRDDKLEANTLKEILEIEQSLKEIK